MTECEDCGRPLMRDPSGDLVCVNSHCSREDRGLEYGELCARYASAVRTLQSIASDAALHTDCGCDSCLTAGEARDTLIQLGEPIEPEGM